MNAQEPEAAPSALHACYHHKFRFIALLLSLCALFCGCAKKAGPQWVETKNGIKVWFNCRAVPMEATWAGPSLAGIAHGQGVFTVHYKDGSSVMTNVVMRWGEMASQSPRRLSAGGTFIGVVKKGAPRGFGVLNLGGCNYIGRFRSDGSARGDVKGYSADKKLLYTGGFKRFGYHGKGTLWKHDGSKYEGEFKRGQKDGYGREWFPDGSRFKGYFKNDLRHGRGALKLSGATRSWHVWEEGKIADRETVIRIRINSLGLKIAPKTKERFERYLSFYELNQWWILVAMPIAIAVLVFLPAGIINQKLQVSEFSEKSLSVVKVFGAFCCGAGFGAHKSLTRRPCWALYPFIVFIAMVFAAKTLFLFLPFPQIWLLAPHVPWATSIILALFAVCCLYDVVFGISYDTYRFNWDYFRRSPIDANLIACKDELFSVAKKVKSHSGKGMKKTKRSRREIHAIYAELKEEHQWADRHPFLANFKEAWNQNEEKSTQKMQEASSDIYDALYDVMDAAHDAIDALNRLHRFAARARHLTLEVLDEVRTKPVLHTKYQRELDAVTFPDPACFKLSILCEIDYSDPSDVLERAEKFFKTAFGDQWRLICGEETKLSKLRHSQSEIISAMSKIVPVIFTLHSVVCDAADKINAHTLVLEQFYTQYAEVRDKLFAEPSASDCWRRKLGYKSRKALLKDTELYALLNPMISNLHELAKLYKRLDEIRLVRTYSN